MFITRHKVPAETREIEVKLDRNVQLWKNWVGSLAATREQI
jgi:hypothetical protein